MNEFTNSFEKSHDKAMRSSLAMRFQMVKNHREYGGPIEQLKPVEISFDEFKWLLLRSETRANAIDALRVARDTIRRDKLVSSEAARLLSKLISEVLDETGIDSDNDATEDTKNSW